MAVFGYAKSMSKILLTLCFILVANTTLATDCKYMIQKLDRCGATPQFTDTYDIICKRGNELSSVDLLSMHKQMEREMETNPCLQKYYQKPIFDQEFYKERYYLNRDRDRERAKERRARSVENMEEKLNMLKEKGFVDKDVTFEEYYYTSNRGQKSEEDAKKSEENKSGGYEYVRYKYKKDKDSSSNKESGSKNKISEESLQEAIRKYKLNK